MRFIADLLDQVQGRMLGSEDERLGSPGGQQPFLARPTLLALGDRHQCHVAHAEFRQHFHGDR
ncbi:hypothetical protein D3C83_44070 [compost metagenome]